MRPPSTAFTMATLVLYQPDQVLRARLASVTELSTFAAAVMRAAAAAFPIGSPPREFDIVVAVKPGRRARFWFVSVPAGEVPEMLEEQLQAIPPPDVHNGAVAVAVVGSVSGASTCQDVEPFFPPIPAAWADAVPEGPAITTFPDGVLPVVWPD